MQSRRFSLTLAKRIRTCPPPAVRNDPTQRQEYANHIAICPYCSALDASEMEAWEILGRHLRDMSMMHDKPLEQEIAPGQLRFFRHDLAGWRNGLFYNRPLVLVIEKVNAVSDDVLVSQTYFDLSMAGPGDLILTGRQTPVGDLFVETWNSYTLKAADLGKSVGHIDPEVEASIKTLLKDPLAYPDWAMVPRPFVDQDPRIYFRELEVEVGFFFATRSVSALMTELESPLRLAHDSVQGLQKAIRKVIPEARWKRPCLSREEVLALVELPAERLPLAADERPIEGFSVNLVRLKAGEVISIEPASMEIHGQSGSVVLSGRVPCLPGDLKHSEFICFIELEGIGPLSPVRYEWKESSGDFLIEFELPSEVPWRLKAAVLFESAEISDEEH